MNYNRLYEEMRMKKTLKHRFFILILTIIFYAGIGLVVSGNARAERLAQQPTVSIPTVTGSPSGPVAQVNADQDQINVRSGPGTDYPIVGILVAGQLVPALGRNPGGSWVLVAYPGVMGGQAWVYSFNITVKGELPIVEPPPTPTPAVTPTIDPTLAAQFVIELQPTRLPTLTSAAPVVVPTFAAPGVVRSPVGVPMGFLIIGFMVVGAFGLLITFLRGK